MSMQKIILLALFGVLPLTINAQQTADLQNGVRIRVTDWGGHKATGIFLSRSADSISYVADSAMVRVSLSNVRLIEVSQGNSHFKGALKGGLMGTGIGALSGAVVGAITFKKPRSCDFFCLNTRSDAMLFGGVLAGVTGSLLGTVVGAAIGSEKWGPVFWQ
jgi:hypothetical protein